MLDMIMFWKKKKNSEGSTAQHLANLIGSSEQDSSQKTGIDETHKINLDFELFEKNNLAIAKLVVIAGLIRNDDRQRREILRSIEPDSLGENSFECYLFDQIRASLQDRGQVSPSQIGMQIYRYKPQFEGKASSNNTLEGHLFRWSLILGFEPTPAQVEKAINIIRESNSG